MSYILGVSALYHDAAAALIHDGRIVAAASEERFSRIKHDASFPVLATRYCLQKAGIPVEAIDHVVYYEKPLRKFERILVSQVTHFPRTLQSFRRATFNWLTDKLWVRANLSAALGVRPETLLFCDHHLSHAASAFYCANTPNAAILTVDGVGEWATTSLYRGGPGGIELLSELQFPHSIGLVYSAFTAYLGFAVNDGEYKVMGMAPYGEPRFEDAVRKVLRLRDDGSVDVDLRYVSYHYSATDSFTGALEDLLGPARFPGSPFDPQSAEGRRFADIAASIQKVTEDALVGLAKALHRQVSTDTLCLAGGVALNSVANRHILQRGPFQRLFVQPAAGDAGGAIGAALWAHREVLGQPLPADVGLRPDLGAAYPDEAIGELLGDLKVRHEVLDDDQLVARAAADIAAGQVIGWVQGGFEWGPRALGHRSILANPADPAMKERVNQRIKFRELFRPFAPSVTVEAAGTYFDLPPGGEQPLDWMLMVTPVHEAHRDTLSAVTHVDGSARVQTVRAETSPLYHRLLQAVGQRTGHPVALNTSFNLKGEPIVSSPVAALATFTRSGLDALYLGRYRVEKEEAHG
jgi:carbamoyltransferase